MRKPLFYWSNMRPGGGMPVAFTVPGGHVLRSIWTGVWGVSIGPFFIGVTRGTPAMPDPTPAEEVRP